MVRVKNNKRILVREALGYIEQEIHGANNDLREELDTDNKLDVTYKTGRDASAKTHVKNAIKMFRWLVEVEFSLTVPNAYTNAEVDAIDIDIRTFDDGK